MSYVIAVDSGGTFTDCVVLDGNGTATRAKAPSTPPQFEQGVLDAVTQAAKQLGMPLGTLLAGTTLFAHGTTVATNILITRTGPRTALLTTRGHEDVMLIGRTVQKVAGLSEAEIINVAALAKAEPLVPRTSIHGIDERVDRAGQIVAPLKLDRLEGPDGLRKRLRDAGVESIAISLLWSFLNPEHERKLREWLAGGDDGWFVTASSDLAPVIREYERTSTTVLNAYLTPGVHRYLDIMAERLRAEGHRGAITVMHSSGGVSSIEEARERGVALLSSGPAGGMLGARNLAARLGLDRVIATDVGGTSFDIGMVVDGEPAYAEAPIFAQHPVALPIIDVASIGAGGGSIAWVEKETGVLKVGPRSAGASPGPVCYGAGGTEPTVTDANVVLGRIDPANFLGGRIRLDADAAREAVREQVAEPLGLTPEEAAARVIGIVDAQMADLIRRVTVERGLDPARLTVLAYGGAGGLHAGAYAATLGCRHVVVPREAAVFSAMGIGLSDAKRIAQVSDPARAPFDLDRWRTTFDGLAAGLRADFAAANLPAHDLTLRRFVDLQFRGQVHTVRVPVEDADLAASDGGERVIGRFTDSYEETYGPGTAYRKAGVEAMTFSVEAVAGLGIPEPAPLPDEGKDASAARSGQRLVHLGPGTSDTVPTYEAAKLRPGNRLAGPAIIEAVDTTVLVHPGQHLWVDGHLNLRLDLT
ncbi:hydantoinase/oxoprolinase family protein [Actinomadura sp. 3N508]|uniref:hydantoinase/oxoprolinase family protein n=1 Tax=Actinomadura sp. 3N508 TaxID=3375153 RepID=UPI0037A3CF45